MATRWVYIGWRGPRYIVRTVKPKAASFRRWLESSFRLNGRVQVLPSPAHDKRSPRSLHRESRALDVFPESDEEGWKIAHTVADYPEGADVQMILWKDWQWGGRAGPGWRYTGRTDHDDHLHIEQRP